MFALIFALVLTSPRPPAAPRAPECDENGYPIASAAACRASCEWWSKPEKRCRDADQERLGMWDARPLDWSTSTGTARPDAWPSFSLEKANAN